MPRIPGVAPLRGLGSGRLGSRRGDGSMITPSVSSFSAPERLEVPQIEDQWDIDLTGMSTSLAKARVLTMTQAQIARLSEEDAKFAQAVLLRQDNAMTGKPTMPLERIVDTVKTDGRYDYDSNLPLMDNIENLGSNFLSGTGDVLQGAAETIVEPYDKFLKPMSHLLTGGIQKAQKSIEDRYGLGDIMPQRSPERQTQADENIAMAEGFGESVANAASNPGQTIFRNPAETAMTLAQPARALGLRKVAAGLDAPMTAAKTAVNLGRKAAPAVGEFVGSKAQTAAKALSGLGVEQQGNLRSMLDDFSEGGQRAGIFDALKRGKGKSTRQTLREGDTPSLTGEGISFEDDMIQSVVKTQNELILLEGAAKRRLEALIKQSKLDAASERKLASDRIRSETPLEPPVEPPVTPGSRWDTMKDDVFTKANRIPEDPPAPKPSRWDEMKDDVFTQANRIPDDTPVYDYTKAPKLIGKDGNPIKQQKAYELRRAYSEYTAHRELSEVYKKLLPTHDAPAKLQIPNKLQQLLKTGNESMISKLKDAEELTKVSVLPRASGYSVSSPSSSSLAGANVAAQGIQIPTTILISAMTGLGMVTISPAMIGLLAITPLTSPRNITKILAANSWARHQIKAVTKVTKKLRDIKGMDQLVRQGITYGALFNAAGLSQDDLIKGNFSDQGNN